MFDAKAKTLLLEADQAMQMHQAMAEPRGFYMGVFPVVQQFLVLEVRRENIVNDTIAALTRYASADLKKPLKVINGSLILLFTSLVFTGFARFLFCSFEKSSGWS